MMWQITNFIRPLHARDSNENHRAATQLELFFDLVIVIAFAAIAKQLHHELVDGHVTSGIIHFIMAFILVWWPWNLFTWFASSFDNDDMGYRMTVMVMMAGSMIIAAALPQAMSSYDLTYVFIGYLVTRLAHVIMWFRVGRNNPKMRPMANRYVAGQVLMQSYWAIIVFMLKPVGIMLYSLFVLGFAVELFIPRFAEKKHNTTWHRHHIVERFGLLNIIVLGEVLLAATVALKGAFSNIHVDWLLIGNSFCGIVIAFAMWWLYFADDKHIENTKIRCPFRWAYGHVIVFSTGVATGAGLEVMNAAFAHHGAGEHHAADPYIAAWAVSIPIALYVVGLWYVREIVTLSRNHGYTLLFIATLIALSPLISTLPYLPTALIVLCVFIRQIKLKSHTNG
ncbi:MAG: low temperature requirement protein A [Cyanobacteria bacterium P01_B01_bin.77]